jgi:hypothetical protein
MRPSERLLVPIEIDCSIGNVELFVVVRHDLLDRVELRDGGEVVGSVGEALRSVACYAPESLSEAGF